MNFSIVTPSFRNSKWLKLCIASVADQEGVTREHIVQDSCSDDGTQDWLPQDKRVKAFVEKDKGMYDAINRGWKRAQGDIVAYINCDEQYLPGALKAVRERFEADPALDVVFGDNVVVDDQGKYICHRPAMVPLESQMWFRFSVLTSSIFLRRKTLEQKGLYFDTQWRDVGDFFWLRDMVLKRAKMAVLPEFTAIFTETGENMNLKPNARREAAVRETMIPPRARRLRFFWIMHYRLRLLWHGAYTKRPFDYSLYTLASPEKRVNHHVAKPSGRWPGRS